MSNRGYAGNLSSLVSNRGYAGNLSLLVSNRGYAGNLSLLVSNRGYAGDLSCRACAVFLKIQISLMEGYAASIPQNPAHGHFWIWFSCRQWGQDWFDVQKFFEDGEIL